MLLGPGDNGKSILLGVEGRLLGVDNISTRGLQDIDRDRFAKADLFGKFANIHADLSSTALVKTGAFKMLTGGDRLTAERKFQQPFTFVNFAKLHFSANELPATKDQTHAFFERWLLIEPPYRFVDHPRENGNEKRRDPRLLQKLTTNEELAGILNLALDGLDRLLTNGQFTKSKASEAVKERWIARTDSLQTFVEKCVSPQRECFTTKNELYEAYQEYCQEYGLAAVDKTVVGTRLPTLVPTTNFKPQIDGKRVTAWKGISVAGVSERQDSQGSEVTTPDLGSFSSHVTDVKEDFVSTSRSASDVIRTNNEPEKGCENHPDMCDGSIDFVDAAIRERLQLKQASGIHAINVDELMVGIVKDIHLDHSYLDPADIAAKFRIVQQSDEGRQLIDELVQGSEISNDDRETDTTKRKS
jgi:P4 family phage/plasmid primase-like protien